MACDKQRSHSDYFNKLVVDAIEKASPSVVGITIKIDSFSENPSLEYSSNENSFGSGLTINNRGYIVTNAHVVENANKIIVTTMGGNKYPAEIIGIDRLTDIMIGNKL